MVEDIIIRLGNFSGALLAIVTLLISVLFTMILRGKQLMAWWRRKRVKGKFAKEFMEFINAQEGKKVMTGSSAEDFRKYFHK